MNFLEVGFDVIGAIGVHKEIDFIFTIDLTPLFCFVMAL